MFPKNHKFTTFIDVQKFTRKLSIQRHFLAQPPRVVPAEIVGSHVHSGLSNPSLVNPPGTIAPSIHVFRSLVLQDLEKLSHKNVHIDPNVKAGLKQL